MNGFALHFVPTSARPPKNVGPDGDPFVLAEAADVRRLGLGLQNWLGLRASGLLAEAAGVRRSFVRSLRGVFPPNISTHSGFYVE